VGDGELHRDMTVMEGRCGLPAYGCNDADELGEKGDVVRLAPLRKHVMAQMLDVVPHPVVRIEECLNMLPHALNRVCMSEGRRMLRTNL
jgi:hypothetical protein